jgi:putative transposase
MQYFGSGLTRKINKMLGSDGPLFRSRYRSILIASQDYLIQLLKYIHVNPVEAKIVDRPEDYLLSSYRDYIDNSPSDWVTTAFCFELFSNKTAFEQLKTMVCFVTLALPVN